MDVAFYIVLLISFPVFYIIGIVAFIKSLQRRPAPSAVHSVSGALTSGAAAAKLRQYAAAASPEVAAALYKIAHEFDGTPAPAAPTAGLIMPGDKHQGASRPVPQHAAVTSGANVWNSDMGSVMHSLDNINVILYLGAFLVVVSAGIFVGVNFGALSGLFTTILLGIFAASFYSVGLLLFKVFPKLRPAGSTFTGIGLVLLPLIGLAAYNFTGLSAHGSAVWLVTSIITLIAYVITLTITRQTYIAYLMAFTALSLFESSVSLFNLPLYWFGWAMGVTGIVLLLLSRSRFFWKDAAAGLMISANIFVPLSLILSVSSCPDNGLSQLGITIAVAGSFYAGMVKRFKGLPPADVYFGLALLSLPSSLAIGLWDSQPRWAIAAIMAIIGLAYLAAEYSIGTQLSRRWREAMGLVSGLLPVAGALVMFEHPRTVLLLMIGACIVNAIYASRLRQSALGLIAILCFLWLPYIFARSLMDPALSWGWVGALLLAETPFLAVWNLHMRDWPDSGRAVGAFGPNAAIILAILTSAVMLSAPVMLGIAFAAALLWYGLSYAEQEDNYIYAGTAALYLSLFQVPASLDWNRADISVVLLMAGSICYLAGSLHSAGTRARAWRYSGIAGPFLGALAGLFLFEPHYQPAFALLIGAGLLFAEGYRTADNAVKEASFAIMIISLNWFCIVGDITQTQMYTLPWAAYMAALAYRHRHQGHEQYDAFTVLSLCFLTLPLAIQALAPDGQVYGLLLILESIALVFAGLGLRYRLLTAWGITALVIEVLYQMKDVFLAMPKYLISAGLGLGLLAVAIVLLQRRKGGE